jgi:ABC-2 type transport system permease protein
MISIFFKEINSFFSSFIGYIVIGVFLVVMGAVMWLLPGFTLLEYNVASMSQLFEVAPVLFLFLIPAVTMRSFAEEKQSGTIEMLATKPLTDLQISLGKFFANLLLVLIALLPTLIYYYSIYQLGIPKGNIDSGAVAGSYIGLILLAGSFVAIGLFASTLTNNQIVSFILAAFLCFVVHWGFNLLSRVPVFVGSIDDIIQMLGIEYHYLSVSRGVIDTRDVLYFFSVIGLFIAMTVTSLERRKW